mmetsp:Transcript_30141/g.77933  ORF Transcript_30141/g.77933 Transcript_30141/m.77933 type:complete len:255 (-) Transcript_30141:311-1075(-)
MVGVSRTAPSAHAVRCLPRSRTFYVLRFWSCKHAGAGPPSLHSLDEVAVLVVGLVQQAGLYVLVGVLAVLSGRRGVAHVKVGGDAGDGEADAQVDSELLIEPGDGRERGDEHGGDHGEVLGDVVKILEHKRGGEAAEGEGAHKQHAQPVVALPEHRDAALVAPGHERKDREDEPPDVQLRVLPMDGLVGVLQVHLAVHAGGRRQPTGQNLCGVARHRAAEPGAAVRDAVLQLAEQRPDCQQQHRAPLQGAQLLV